MIPDKQIKRALRFAKSVLASQFNDAKTQAILTVMESNYQTLSPQYTRIIVTEAGSTSKNSSGKAWVCQYSDNP